MRIDDVSSISDAALADVAGGGDTWTPKAIAEKLGYDWKAAKNWYTGTLAERKAIRDMAFTALRPVVDGSLAKIVRKLR